MQKVPQRIKRIVDANFNRSKEGLRVCEDICRFVRDDRALTRDLKTLRHQLTAALGSLKLLKFIDARDIASDVGRFSNRSELKRRNVADIFYANAQRVKESVRVLEELTKLIDRSAPLRLKKIRYAMYALEKKFFKEK